MTNQDSGSDAHQRKVIQSVSDAKRDASRSSKQHYAIVELGRHAFAVFTVCPLLQSSYLLSVRSSHKNGRRLVEATVISVTAEGSERN